jgi:hypothetical protein
MLTHQGEKMTLLPPVKKASSATHASPARYRNPAPLVA